MRNAFKIFFSDLRCIGTHFFSLVIAISVLIIPALYAWVNIYANWDPYGNTGNIKIALASRDLGYTSEAGEYINAGQEILEEISKSTSIDWTIVDDPDEAINSVRSGKYYAALVMEENLSRNMYDIKAALRDENPSIVFYQNAKVNAIANKITTTAATTAEHNIQVKYLGILIERLFENINVFLDHMDAEEHMDALIEMLTDLRDSLQEYSLSINSLSIMDDSLINIIDEASNQHYGISQGTMDSIAAVSASIESIRGSMLGRIDNIGTRMEELKEKLSTLDGAAISQEGLDSILENVAAIKSNLQGVHDSMPEGSAAAQITDAMISQLNKLEEQLHSLEDSGIVGVIIDDLLRNWQTQLNDLLNLNEQQLRPAINLFFDGMKQDADILNTIANSIDTSLANIPPVLTASKASILSLRSSVQYLQNFLSSAAQAADKILQRVVGLRESGRLNDLIELLNGDPEEFAEFLSQPVQVVTEEVYPVENYGSAVAPFYSTLAIWVGGVVLTAIFKTEAEPEEYLPRRMEEHHLYWGRFITFFVLSQIQAAVIVWGDIHILHCQCLNPGLFYLCGSVTAFVFTALIYSLALSFGDVGKAIVVVVMITQIAGSSGTYPIEILPPIFSRIYLFFPFPYAINAMREAICGLYGADIYIYLLELMVFGVIGILIGLVVRRSFVKVNLFVEEEIERTGIL